MHLLSVLLDFTCLVTDIYDASIDLKMHIPYLLEGVEICTVGENDNDLIL